MKQLLLFLIWSCSFSLFATTIHVTTSGVANSNGISWLTPTTLQHAISVAKAGDQIWVAVGVYTPGQGQQSSFKIKAGVQLYGGFLGFESHPQQRNFNSNHHSILTGNIGDFVSSEDNVSTVVTMLQADEQTRLDGFTIEGGLSAAFDRNQTLATSGGGLYISGTKAGYGPTISNCTFLNNQARFGGAVFINGVNSRSEPVFTNCTFINNKADFRGGAVYNQATDGLVSPIFTDCTFTNNKSDRGACLFNEGTRGKCAPRINASTFTFNQALTDGAVLYNSVDGTKGEVKEIMTNCKISDNNSYMGNDKASSFKVTAKQQGAQSPQTGSTLRAVN